MASTLPRPAFDPELEEALKALNLPSSFTKEHIALYRAAPERTPEMTIAGRPIEHRTHTIAGPGGELALSIFQATSVPDSKAGRPGIYFAHGGGMVIGSRVMVVGPILDAVVELGAVCVSVEYRLAPENPFPAGVEDCYAGLVWTQEHAAELGIDPSNLLLAGASAGGGVAAGAALMARDRGTLAVRAQLLMCPMLDDRNTTVSSQQYIDSGTWTGGSNVAAWGCVLGDDRGGDNVSIYAAPGRATDLSGLPPTMIEVGAAEVFRDEAVAYASRLWASGVQAELHVWPGGYHGFNNFVAEAKVSRAANEAVVGWIRRTMKPLASE